MSSPVCLGKLDITLSKEYGVNNYIAGIKKTSFVNKINFCALFFFGNEAANNFVRKVFKSTYS